MRAAVRNILAGAEDAAQLARAVVTESFSRNAPYEPLARDEQVVAADLDLRDVLVLRAQ